MTPTARYTLPKLHRFVSPPSLSPPACPPVLCLSSSTNPELWGWFLEPSLPGPHISIPSPPAPAFSIHDPGPYIWRSDPGLRPPSESLPLSHCSVSPTSPPPNHPSPHTRFFPRPLPDPHPGSWLRAALPGTRRDTHTGSCLACSRSARGRTAAARGGTRPHLWAEPRG